MNHLLLIRWLTALLIALPSLGWALPDDRNQPINIESDHARMDDHKRTTRYYGDAVLTQGTLKIEGDVITLYYDDNKQIVKMIAKGKPARYQQLQNPISKPVRARALQMEYHAQSQMIYLLEQGYVWDNGDIITGSRIEYDTHNNRVIANSAPDKIGDGEQQDTRVNMVIHPNTSQQVAPSSPQVEAETSLSQSSLVTAITRINMRIGPGKQYSKLGVISKGSQLIILAEQEDWLQVSVSINGRTVIGWVARRLVNVVNDEQ